MSNDQREAWFARVMESGLENNIFAPSDVLAHATPDVLATHLPAELLSKMISSSLAAGSMTPERVLETVTPQLLAKHLPHDVLWQCIQAAVARAGVASTGGPVNIKAFFVAALSTGLEQHLATPEDILRHATPDVLSMYLPRPLWSRLLAACLGAPRVDATLIVETVGVPNLVEHVPAGIIWACVSEFGARSLGAAVPSVVPASTGSRPIPLATPPPPDELAKPVAPAPAPAPTAKGPHIPAPELVEVEGTEERPIATATSPGSRARPPAQRFRQSSTGIGRLAPTSSTPTTPTPVPSVASASANAARKPQVATTTVATVAAPPAPPDIQRVRRGHTETDHDLETAVGGDDWKNALAVEDEQLVDWAASDDSDPPKR